MEQTHARVMLTGVTGLIGGALAVELLTRTDSRLLCLVRESADASAQSRLAQALQRSAQMYGTTLTEEQLERAHAFAGDITSPLGGIDPDAVGVIDEVWHAAASLAFEEHKSAAIEEQNVVGTSHMLTLAQAAGARAFNYVSTAYVAGRRLGLMPEAVVGADVESNNAYERSKIAAENLVLGSGFATVRVFRPSIVIGHSQTYVATTFSGLYGFVRGLQRARNDVRATLGDLLKYRPLHLLANGETPVNFIPVDYVARNAVAVALVSDDSEIYHLANSTPPFLKSVLDGAAKVLGMQFPVFTDNRDDFTLIDEKVDEQMDFYRSYMNDDKYFAVGNVEKLVGEGALSYRLDAEVLGHYVEWYLAEREMA